MRFKTQNYKQSIPNIDLIPMLNVMMSVLAFFILVSMNLTTGTQGVEVQLPKREESEAISLEEASKNLIVTINSDETFTINNEIIQTQEQLKNSVNNYLVNDSEGLVFLMAEKTVSYKKVMEILTQLKIIGEERISLAITVEE